MTIIDEFAGKIKANKELYKNKFLEIQNISDLLKLLELDYKSIQDIHSVPSKLRYTCFTIPKKSGKKRVIYAPVKDLKLIQSRLNNFFQLIYPTRIAAHGFLPNRSIVTNAKKHQYKKLILNLDLKDFFSTITIRRIVNLLNSFELPQDIVLLLSDLCCYDGYLPQGAPTSPILSNMLCVKMDNELTTIAKKYKITYTRYGDDITFSTTSDNFPLMLEKEILRVVKKSGFKINHDKYRLQSRKVRQEVTGLTVNEFPNIQRGRIRYIKTQLHFWQNKGVKCVVSHYIKHNMLLNLTPNEAYNSFKLSLRGKIEFIGMVRGKDDKIYKKFKNTFYELSKTNNLSNKNETVKQPTSAIVQLPIVEESAFDF